MVQHIVMWNFTPSFSAEEKREAAKQMKAILEPLRDVVPGTIDIRVQTDYLESSNREITLFSSFESEEALKNYLVHPAHVEAGKYVRSVTCDRACLDFVSE